MVQNKAAQHLSCLEHIQHYLFTVKTVVPAIPFMSFDGLFLLHNIIQTFLDMEVTKLGSKIFHSFLQSMKACLRLANYILVSCLPKKWKKLQWYVKQSLKKYQTKYAPNPNQRAKCFDLPSYISSKTDPCSLVPYHCLCFWCVWSTDIIVAWKTHTAIHDMTE